MDLGESIYRLRTARNMSQGDLADALDVSRQSVSKWENNMAVPELDKLMKMSELFGVSLDALVRGEAAAPVPPPDIPQTPKNPSAVAEQRFPTRKIAGTILFCMAFLTVLVCTALGGMLEGLVFSLPFLLCGTICFLFRKNVGLWCAWTVFGLVDIYMSLATGASRGTLIAYLRLGMAPTVSFYISLALIFFLLLLFTLTMIRFRKMQWDAPRKRILLLGGGWIVWAVLPLFLRLFAPEAGDAYGDFRWFSVVSIFVDWIRIPLFTALCVRTLAILRALRKQK